MEKCRACLSTQSLLIPLDQSFLQGYNLLTHLNIVIPDALPQVVCSTCSESVCAFINFRDRCITAEATLQQEFLEKFKKEEEQQISDAESFKLEIKQEVENTEIADFNNDFENYESLDFQLLEEESEMIPKEYATRKSKRVKKKKLTLDEKIKAIVKPLKPKRPYRKGIQPAPEPTYLDCGLCEMKFDDKITFSEHLETHRNGKQCGICHEQFNHWPALFAHRLSHLGVTTSRCHICNKFAFSVNYLEWHYLKKHYEEKVDIACKQCQRTYKTVRKLNSHMRATHTEKTYACDHCSKVCKTKFSLRAHMVKHSDNFNHICDICGAKFKRKMGLAHHKVRAHCPNKVTCDLCKQIFGNQHHKVRAHCPNKVTCDLCKQIFGNQEKMERHKCASQTFMCPTCGKQLITSKSHFDKHVRGHGRKGQYKCNRCPKTYTTKSALQVHIDHHDGVRRHQCEFCQRKFFSLSVLIKHRRVHTGERPFVCKICQKAFTGNHNLKVHMRVHGEYLVVKRVKEDSTIS